MPQNILLRILAVAAAFVIVSTPTFADNDLAGTWAGTLVFGEQKLALVFNITLNPDGTVTATADSPDQGATGIPVKEMRFEDGHVFIDVAVTGGVFEGDLSEDKTSITGEWRQSGLVLPLVLEKTDKAPTLNRPQTPEPPFPYDAEEVTYRNEKAAITMAGTLTLPRGESPVPAVLLISGSGAQDRDETIMGHKPFLVLADYLTSRGIAVLRVDDRGVGGTDRGPADPTSLDFVGDALSGVAFLKNHPKVSHDQIGFVGHSEGAMIAAMAAVESPDDIAFIVMMGGSGIAGEQLIYLQLEHTMRAEGASEDEITETLELQRALFAVLRENLDDSTARRKMVDIYRNSLPDSIRNIADADVLPAIDPALTAWYKFFIAYDPTDALRQVRCPVLGLIGEKDVQVPPKENLPPIETALREGGNTNFTVKELEGLNHLFQTAGTGGISEYGKIEETMAPVALETITEWIQSQLE